MLSVADHKNTHESITQHEGQRNRTVMGTPTAAMSMLQIRPEAGDASSYEYLRITASTVLAPGVRTHCVDVAINECVEPGSGFGAQENNVGECLVQKAVSTVPEVASSQVCT